MLRAVPGDQNIKGTGKHKIPGLEIKGAKVMDVKATVIPIVVGTLGTVCEELENHLKTTAIPIVISCLQKAALLGTAFIRMLLNIS